MMQLRFVGVDDDGRLLLLDEVGNQEFQLEVDERLRAALRPRPQAGADVAHATPRQVQSLMRAGQSSAEIAESLSWPLERVARFEAPILAERAHVARTAAGSHVRGRAVDGVFPTLGARVNERLQARGVDERDVRWDAVRPEGGQWTVLIVFVAGNRERRASWRFDPAHRSVEALDDEARWLSEDEQALPARPDGLFMPAGESGVDLVTTMRERSRARRRPKKSASPATTPVEQREVSPGGPSTLPEHAPPEDGLLPLEDLRYDPDTMGLPPAAGYADPAQQPPAGRNDSDASRRDDEAPDEAAAEEQDVPPAPEAEVTLGDFFELDEDTAGTPELTDDDLTEDLDDEVLDNEVLDNDELTDDDLDDDELTDGIEPSDDEVDRYSDDGDSDGGDSDEDVDTLEEPDPPAESKRKGRPSVPSWDDIMFGARSKR